MTVLLLPALTVVNALMELLHSHANVILDGLEMFAKRVSIFSKKFRIHYQIKSLNCCHSKVK